MPALNLARRYLLEPFCLDESAFAQSLGEIGKNHVDFADLYFQYAAAESWLLEEGIVKKGSFHIDQGVGVRAIAGDKTAYAYSDDLSLAALLNASKNVRAIAAAGQSARVAVPNFTEQKIAPLYPADNPLDLSLIHI